MVAVATFTSVNLVSAAGAVIDNPDLDTFGDYTYVADPETGVVTVTAEISVTADKPSSLNYYYYFTGSPVVLPAEAENVVVTNSGGRELNYEADTSYEDLQILDVSFGFNLHYRRETQIVVSYTLPGGTARDDAVVRVNDAYVGFPVTVDPTLEAASVRIEAPEGFEDSPGFSPWSTDTDSEGTVLIHDDIDPELYFEFASLTNDDELVDTEFSVDGTDFVIRSWPGDRAWVDHVESSLTDGYGPLSASIGLEWPHEEPLTIVESFTPYINGYGGWYDDEAVQIEMGDELEQALVFHEVSHAWLNDDLFIDRWITEGLAEFFAAETIESVGGDRPEPDRTSPNDEHAHPLVSWQQRWYLPDEEGWAYRASWTATEELAAEAGPDALRRAIALADSGETVYVGDGEAEQLTEVASWKQYIDYLEADPAVDAEAIEEIFVEWVLGDREVELLERRNAARAEYAAIDDAGDRSNVSWAPPLGLRTAMTEWNLVVAERLLEDSEEILGDRDEISTLIAPFDGTLPPDLEEAYETADDRLNEVNVRIDEALATAEVLHSSHERLEAATGLFQRIGAIGGDTEDTFDAAVAAFEAGDDERSADLAAEVDDAVATLADEGTKRAAIGSGTLVAAALAWFGLRRKRRSGPASGETESAAADADDDGSSEDGSSEEDSTSRDSAADTSAEDDELAALP